MKFKILTLSMVLLVVLVLASGLTGCSDNRPSGILTQYSTIDALMNGLYDGVAAYGDIVKQGDTGVGTFENLDGEMIELEGHVYQIKSDGQVYKVNNSAKAPFAEVTFFKADSTVTLPAGVDLAGLQLFLDKQLSTLNSFYSFQINGKFNYMKTRSVPAQSKPYPGLLEATKGQKVFEFNDIEGTIVGFRCPVYAGNVNVAGYHLHFISADRNHGGHILDLKSIQGEAKIDRISQFNLILPGSGSGFYQVDFSKDQSANVQKAESK